jgi:hypothetical protein
VILFLSCQIIRSTCITLRSRLTRRSTLDVVVVCPTHGRWISERQDLNGKSLAAYIWPLNTSKLKDAELVHGVYEKWLAEWPPIMVALSRASVRYSLKGNGVVGQRLAGYIPMQPLPANLRGQSSTRWSSPSVDRILTRCSCKTHRVLL